MHYLIWSSSRSSFSGEVAKLLGFFRRGGGIAFIQKKCGIYTKTHWHLYNNTLAFIQQLTGIYTTTHWHLYNNTLAFIQKHTGIYTTTHWHLYNNTLAFIQVMSFFPFLPNSSWHSAMNSMQTNKMRAIHGRVLPNFSFSFLPKLFMALCHERHAQSKCMPFMAECCPIFLFPSFPNSSWHSAMNSMHNLNACHSWQSAAQFFFFLPSQTLHGTLP